MPTVTVKRSGDTVEVVIRESMEEQHNNDHRAWTITEEEDLMCLFTVWTLRLPADEADVLSRGLMEAGGGRRDPR